MYNVIGNNQSMAELQIIKDDLIQEIINTDEVFTLVNTSNLYETYYSLKSKIGKNIVFVKDNVYGLVSEKYKTNPLAHSMSTFESIKGADGIVFDTKGQKYFVIVNPLDLDNNRLIDLVKNIKHLHTSYSPATKKKKLKYIIIKDLDNKNNFTELIQNCKIINDSNKTVSNPYVYKITGNSYITGMNQLYEWAKNRKDSNDLNDKVSLKGISVLGFPGTGKSLSASLVARVLDRDLYRLELHSVMDQYVGNSEANLKYALSFIKSLNKPVILVDEIDKMFSKHGQDTTSSNRVLSILLQFMEDNKDAFFVFTGNNIDNIPPELLRKGRLDEFFYAQAPSEEDIKSYIEFLVLDYKLNIDLAQELLLKVTSTQGVFLYPEIKSMIDDLYIFLQEGDYKRQLDEYQLVSTVSRNMRDYCDLINWSKENAKPIN